MLTSMPASSAVERRPSFQPFQCHICQSRFTRHENLKRHAALHTRTQDEAALPCDLCQAVFSRPDLRSRHMKRKHPDHEETRAKKRPQRDCRDAETSRKPSHRERRTGGARADQGAFVSPVSISNSRRASNPPPSSDEGDLEMDVVGSWQSASHFEPSSFDRHQLDTAHLATSVPSSADSDEANMSHATVTQQILSNTSNTHMGMLMAAPFLDPPDRFEAPASFEPTVNPFSFDQDIPDGLLSLDLTHIQDDWAPSSLQVSRGRALFFAHVSHFVPFLHEPTLDTSQVADYLLLGILALAYQHGEDPDSGNRAGSGHDLSVRCFHRARVLITYADERTLDSAHSTAMVQAYLLLQIFAMMYLCGGESSYGLKTHSKMIALARAGGLMQPAFDETDTAEDLDSLWRQFARAESQKRTAFAVHQVDALWYQFLSIPRQLSHLEIKHELPCPEDFWTAPSSADWAHQRLMTRHSGTSVQYSEAVRRFLSDVELDAIPAFDAYGAINVTQFLISSAREISGWSTMTGRLSTERLEPLKTSLLALTPFMRSAAGAGAGAGSSSPHDVLCDATWETAMIEMQMWSPSHTGGIVGGSMDAALGQLTFLAPSPAFLCEAGTAEVVMPHVEWFLRYLDLTLVVEAEAPWITVFAYKAFMIAWQLVRGGLPGAMRVVGVQDGDVEGALAWARKVFRRRERWQLGKIILSCLDTLQK